MLLVEHWHSVSCALVRKVCSRNARTRGGFLVLVWSPQCYLCLCMYYFKVVLWHQNLEWTNGIFHDQANLFWPRKDTCWTHRYLVFIKVIIAYRFSLAVLLWGNKYRNGVLRQKSWLFLDGLLLICCMILLHQMSPGEVVALGGQTLRASDLYLLTSVVYLNGTTLSPWLHLCLNTGFQIQNTCVTLEYMYTSVTCWASSRPLSVRHAI